VNPSIAQQQAQATMVVDSHDNRSQSDADPKNQPRCLWMADYIKLTSEASRTTEPA